MKKLPYLLTFLMIIATVVFNATAATIVTDGLVSYWTFDEQDITDNTVKDVWGNNNGTIVGEPKIVAGQVGDALQFDGAKDYVNLTNLGDFGRSRRHINI